MTQKPKKLSFLEIYTADSGKPKKRTIFDDLKLDDEELERRYQALINADLSKRSKPVERVVEKEIITERIVNAEQVAIVDELVSQNGYVSESTTYTASVNPVINITPVQHSVAVAPVEAESKILVSVSADISDLIEGDPAVATFFAKGSEFEDPELHAKSIQDHVELQGVVDKINQKYEEEIRREGEFRKSLRPTTLLGWIKYIYKSARGRSYELVEDKEKEVKK